VPIRHANSADIPNLMVLEKSADTAGHWSQQQYEDVFSGTGPRRVALVLEENGLQGFLVGRVVDKEWELENIVVAEFARRRGLGTQLLHAFLDLARSEGAKTVVLEVRESNLAARRLYEKLKFAETGRRKSYYSRPQEDAILYRLR
jgi:ribosomal-protein-alanine N-acetyltransferase